MLTNACKISIVIYALPGFYRVAEKIFGTYECCRTIATLRSIHLIDYAEFLTVVIDLQVSGMHNNSMD